MVLLDVSGSMWPVLQRVSESARAACDQLRPGDRIGVAAFAVRGRILQPLTDNREEAERALGDFRKTGLGTGTKIITGLDTVAKYLLSEPRQERRRAVLLITDNVGTRSVREDPVVRAFWEADAVVTGLEVSDPMARVSRVIKWTSPTAIAMAQGADGVIRKTGGEMEKTGDAGKAFGEALHRLRTRYSIYYAPPAGRAGEEHRVKVTLSPAAAKAHPNARIRARAGYVMPALTK
jgi:von Willebrand factor type A domain